MACPLAPLDLPLLLKRRGARVCRRSELPFLLFGLSQGHTNQYHSTTLVRCISTDFPCVTFIMNKDFIGAIGSRPTYYGTSGYIKARRVAVQVQTRSPGLGQMYSTVLYK